MVWKDGMLAQHHLTMLEATYPTVCRDELSDGASGDESFDGSSALLKVTCAHQEATPPKISNGVEEPSTSFLVNIK